MVFSSKSQRIKYVYKTPTCGPYLFINVVYPKNCFQFVLVIESCRECRIEIRVLLFRPQSGGYKSVRYRLNDGV